MLHEIFSSTLLGPTTNFTDQNDAFGDGVVEEDLQTVDEVGSVERITTDTHTQRLTQTDLRFR